MTPISGIETDEYPPTAAIGVVQPADGDSDAWNEVDQSDKELKDADTALKTIEDEDVDDDGDDDDDDVEEDKEPELRARRPAGKIDVTPHGVHVGIHCTAPLPFATRCFAGGESFSGGKSVGQAGFAVLSPAQ